MRAVLWLVLVATILLAVSNLVFFVADGNIYNLVSGLTGLVSVACISFVLGSTR